MTRGFDQVVTTHQLAHDAVRIGYVHAKALIDDGERVRISVVAVEEPISVRQRNFFHGPVLKQISEQVRVEGVRYSRKVWKIHLKDLFIPDQWEMQQKPFVFDKVAGAWRPSKRPVPVKKGKHTENFDIRGYSDFIDKVIAHAVTEWGVEFRFVIDDREAVRYREPASKKTAAKEAATS